MTELAEGSLQAAGSVRHFLPPLPPKKKEPSLKMKRFERIMFLLYDAIINKKGLYARVTMETHAPQLLFYPGSLHLRGAETVAEESLQASLFYDCLDVDLDVLVAEIVQKAKEASTG